MRIRDVAVNTALVLGSSCIALGAAELALRAADLGYGNAPFVSDSLLHHAHPTDYRFHSYAPAADYGGFPVYYDEHGLVADPDGELVYDPGRHRCTVALLGDSFVEAVQVPYEESFAGRLNRIAADSVFFRNYGVSTYSPALSLLQWKHRIAPTRPCHVLLLLYGNDVWNDERYTQYVVRDYAGAVVAVPGAGDDWLVRLLRKSYLARLVRRAQLTLLWPYRDRSRDLVREDGIVDPNPDVTPLTAGYILELAAAVERSGARFTLSAVPPRPPESSIRTAPGPSFAKKVRAWSARNGVDFLDLPPYFRTARRGDARAADSSAATRPPSPFFKRDVHLNALGHALVARALRRYLPDAYFQAAALRQGRKDGRASRRGRRRTSARPRSTGPP